LALVAKYLEYLEARDRRRERVGTDPHGLARSWLQDGCRMRTDRGR
jgi:hypothetical protein